MISTRRHWLAWLTVGAVAAALSACGGANYQVVRQATPNPLVNVHSYLVAPVTWNGFTFNGAPETAWLATRTPEQQSSWQNDKMNVTERMLRRYEAERRADESFAPAAGTPQPGQFVIAANVDGYDHGQFEITYQVLDANGQPVDVIHTRRGGGFGLALQLNSLIVMGTSDIVHYLRTRYRGT